MEDQQQTAAPLSSQQTTTEIALALRIPQFWRDRPRLWFHSFEAATYGSRENDKQLAQMVITQLEKQDIVQITDLLYNPPSQQYQAIKDRLITVYEESDSQQFQKLLSQMELGEQKPSQLLRRMRDLARNRIPDTTLRIMWTNHLPPHVRSVLAVSESFSSKTTLEELSLLADKMIEQNREIAAVSIPSSSPSPSSPPYEFLINEIRKLSLEIAELWFQNKHENTNSHRRGCFTYRQRSRSRTSRTKSSSPSAICYFHKRFGAQARKCVSPCTFKSSEN